MLQQQISRPRGARKVGRVAIDSDTRQMWKPMKGCQHQNSSLCTLTVVWDSGRTKMNERNERGTFAISPADKKSVISWGATSASGSWMTHRFVTGIASIGTWRRRSFGESRTEGETTRWHSTVCRIMKRKNVKSNWSSATSFALQWHCAAVVHVQRYTAEFWHFI